MLYFTGHSQKQAKLLHQAPPLKVIAKLSSRVALDAQKSDCPKTVARAMLWQIIELAAAVLERRQKPRDDRSGDVIGIKPKV